MCKKQFVRYMIVLIFILPFWLSFAEDLPDEERCEYPVWSVRSDDVGSERIAYTLVSKVYGTQIWIIKVDEPRHKIMVTSKNWNRHPYFSWDGKRIVYAGGDDKGIQQIWIMNDDGTNSIQLTTSEEDKIYPVFSPKGDKVIFISIKDNQGFIYEIESSGKGEPLLITRCGNISEKTVLSPISFSPDGKFIAYVKFDFEYKNENIFILNLQNKEERQITKDGFIGSGLSWSSNGKDLAYIAPDKSDKGYSIYVFNLETNEIKKIISAVTPLGVSFSPSGKKICFLRNYQIWIADADGKNQKQLTSQEIVRDLKNWESRKKQNLEALLKLKEYIGRKVWLRKTFTTIIGERLEKLTEAEIVNVRNKILLPEKYRVIDSASLTIEIELKIKGKKFFVVYLSEISGYIDDFSRFFFLTNPYECYDWSKEIWNAIKERRVLLGMDKTQVLLSLGEPDEILKSGKAINELWVYRFKGTVSFENDKVKEFKPITTIELKDK